MRAITVCVNYDDFLARTLPTWLRHFDEILVVTAPGDEGTAKVAAQYGRVVTHATEAFYREGVSFNKGAALEEGFGILGRRGWIAILDADVALPPDANLDGLQIGCLYSPYRRMAPADFDVESPLWHMLPRGEETLNGEYAGYCQIFHALDPAVAIPPWYKSGWPTCGGCDSDFWQRWPEHLRRRPAWDVLHLGEARKNWGGRITPRLEAVA